MLITIEIKPRGKETNEFRSEIIEKLYDFLNGLDIKDFKIYQPFMSKGFQDLISLIDD